MPLTLHHNDKMLACIAIKADLIVHSVVKYVTHNTLKSAILQTLIIFQ